MTKCPHCEKTMLVAVHGEPEVIAKCLSCTRRVYREGPLVPTL